MELVIPALAGLIGVALGALLTRRTEHGRWLRDARQVAYANYDTAYGNVIGLIFGAERTDRSAVEGADDELKGCLSNVWMVGSSEAISCAASIHAVLTAAIVSVLHDPDQFLAEQGVHRPLEEYLLEANEHRAAFIAAARSDLGISPAKLGLDVRPGTLKREDERTPE